MPAASTDIAASDVKQIPAIGSQFTLEIKGLTTAEIKSIDGLALDVQDIESKVISREGKEIQRFNPGNTSYEPVKVTRHFTGDKTFWNWCKDVLDGKVERRDGAVVLHDFAGAETQRWTFLQAWPSDWELSELDADSAEPISETITFQIEHLERSR